MKKYLCLFVCLIVLSTTGCLETVALVASGAVGGVTTARILQQQKEANQANIDLMVQQQTALEAELSAATDEAEKTRIQKQLDATKTVLLELKTTKVIMEQLEVGLGTDWSKPTAVVSTLATFLLAYLADRERRKKNRTTTALAEVVAGGEAFKKAADAEAVVAFKTAHKDAQKSPETREMVATIKA